MNSTSSIMRLFSLLLACSCCNRMSNNFWDLCIASNWGIAKVVAKGIIPVDVRRCWGLDVFRFPLKELRKPWNANQKNNEINMIISYSIATMQLTACKTCSEIVYIYLCLYTCTKKIVFLRPCEYDFDAKKARALKHFVRLLPHALIMKL